MWRSFSSFLFVKEKTSYRKRSNITNDDTNTFFTGYH